MEKKFSYVLFSALGLMVALFIIINLKTVMKIDDDYIGEQVFWLLKEGNVKSELMRGYGNIGLENYQSVFHKLFVYAGAAVSKVSGWSLHSLHFVSAFFTFVSIIALYLFCRRNYSLYVFFAALLCMLSFNEFITFSFSFRPEIMIAALGFISYSFLDAYLKNRKYSFLMASSFFAGRLAFSTHLNGLILSQPDSFYY